MGTLHGLDRSGKVREAFPTREGPPNGPVALRVSTRRQGATGKKARPCGSVVGVKYPLMSSTSSVSLVTKAQTSPFVPAGTMVASALMRPSGEFNVEARGNVPPHGNIVRNPSEP